MFKYSFLFALLALCAVQVTTDTIFGLTNKVKNAISNINDTVTNAENNAIKKLNDALYNLMKFSQKNLDFELNKAVEKIMKINDKNAAIREQADYVSIDVAECFEENEQATNDLSKKIITRFISCITNDIKKAVKLSEGTRNDIKLVGKNVRSLPGKLKHCITNRNKFRCYTSLLAEIVESNVAIPLRITAQVSRTIALINGFKSKIKICAAKKVAEASVKAAVIGVQFAKCVTTQIIT